MPYPEPKQHHHAAEEAAVRAWWEEHGTFDKSLAEREGAPHFVFYEGPPTANGRPGIHHVLARTLKDLFCRYKTMKGFRVDRKGGWDTHGLPVEIEVEKELGLEGRHQVEDYGIAAYNAACRRSVLRYKDEWDELTRRMGYWVDLDDPYVTFHNSYIESVWALLKRLHDKGLLYQGHKIQWYSPANTTVLSSHEVSLGYKEAQDPSVYVRFPVKGEENTSFLAWTTTPWTLPSNAALAVGPKIDYVKAKLATDDGGEEHIIVAKSLLSVLGEGAEVVEEMTGADLVGMRYEPAFSHFADELGADAAWRVVAADYVTTGDGTGVVHTAPAFGMDDFATGQREGIPALNPIEPDGKFQDGFPLVGGMWFKDADRPLIRDLIARGRLFRETSYVHNYPHDWRSGTPLMQYPVDSWFVETTKKKDELIALNQTINWQPESVGTGRFGQWLDGNVDWAISRMRYWGTPLPIWQSDRDPEQIEVVGSIEELKAKVGGEWPEEAINPELGGIDLHRPYVDALTWPDGQGGTMRRIPDLLDVWFDSGAMPFAQWHYPFENEDRFKANVPADFIAEGVDQTRGWFYTLHALAVLLEDRVAYKNVVVNGLVLDKDGNKMSKSKGNAVDPFAALEEHGADPVRWTMMSASLPWESFRYSAHAIVETNRKLFLTLVNTLGFFGLYANLDGYTYDPADRSDVADRAELDRWITSRLHHAAEEADDALDAYHPTRAARAVEAFVEELSNWYVRRSRRRFWKSADDADKKAAYDTLYEALVGCAQLMAPLAPHFAEWLWQSLTKDRADLSDSIHLTRFPEGVADERDADLERRMQLARDASSAALALRNEAGVNVRQPLGRLMVVTGNAGVSADDLAAVEAVIRDEVNVKSVEPIGSDSGVVQKSAKPNFKALGRRLGKQMKAANAAIRALSSDDVARYEADGALTLNLDGEPVVLGPGDLDVVSEGIEGQLVGQENGVTVALDTALTDELKAEGLAREFVNRIQNLRKSAGFDVSDRIAATFSAGERVRAAVEGHADYVQAETLADALAPAADPAHDAEAAETVEIAGEPVRIGVRRV
jgi:isoleucyl-tRNA synthetase